ncbi:hypothetical protein MTO96_038270 [Rhipicephalus appendiculatus]
MLLLQRQIRPDGLPRLPAVGTVVANELLPCPTIPTTTARHLHLRILPLPLLLFLLPSFVLKLHSLPRMNLQVETTRHPCRGKVLVWGTTLAIAALLMTSAVLIFWRTEVWIPDRTTEPEVQLAVQASPIVQPQLKRSAAPDTGSLPLVAPSYGFRDVMSPAPQSPEIPPLRQNAAQPQRPQ